MAYSRTPHRIDDPWKRFGLIGINAKNARMGVGAADDGGVRQPWKSQIVCIRPLTQQ